MVQKKLALMLIAMAGFGLLGVVVAYLIFGKVDGDYISLGIIFSASSNFAENPAQSLLGIDDIRIKVLAGGVAGVLTGLFAPLMSKPNPMNIESPTHKTR